MELELDSRILEGKKPLNCFDTEQAKQFIGKKCYFSDDARDFMNLDKADGDTLFYVAELQNIWTAEEYCFADNSNDYRFILPLEWVKPEESKEPKKKYRPFDIKEFIKKYSVGSVFQIRQKRKKITETCVQYVGYKIFQQKIYLGITDFTLDELFENFEMIEPQGDVWIPFGVLEE